jgi:nucleoside-diphosphate-sugar epimerase
VHGTGRAGDVAFCDHEAVHAALRAATHVLSSVPPDAQGTDPVLHHYHDVVQAAPAQWIGYLSSTGVYGDTDGAWVDETAPLKGRRNGRNSADGAWQVLRSDVRVFRLPGIYGPGRSALDRVQAGKAHRIDLPSQVFSRVHADDVVRGICASFTSGPAGVYNLADDFPASQNAVIDYACAQLGLPYPPLIAVDHPELSPASRAFYSENRRVANGKAKRLLRWQLQYPDFRAGLNALTGAGPSKVV